MKSNDCSNQRLFGGLQIWRELWRCIEKGPRLRMGQPVHRSSARVGVQLPDKGGNRRVEDGASGVLKRVHPVTERRVFHLGGTCVAGIPGGR